MLILNYGKIPCIQDYLKMIKKIYVLAILVLVGQQIQAQHWKWTVGLNSTNYQYKSSTGESIDYIKPLGGMHASFRYNKELIDTTDLISKFSKSAIFFGNHQKLAKIVSLFRYELGVNINQFNATGDIQNIILNYQTNFVGLHAAFGPEVKIYKGFSIGLQGNLGAQKLFSGVQTQISNSKNINYNLADNENFSPIHVMLGYNVEIHKVLTDKTSVFVSYQKSSTFHGWTEGKPSLNFAPTSLSIGLKISKF
jgi:hypothetical protein